MTYAFDLDGTLNAHPQPLGTMMHELKQAGHRCIVLTAAETGTTREQRAKMLSDVGIMPGSYDDIVVQWDDGRGKADYCRKNGVAVLIDNGLTNLERVKQVSPFTVCLHVL